MRNGLAWLRSWRVEAIRAAAPTELAIPAEQAYRLQPPPPGYTEAGEEPMRPLGIIQFNSALTEEETNGLRAAFTAAMNAAAPLAIVALDAPGDPVEAPAAETVPAAPARTHNYWCHVCSVRYSRCYCGDDQ